MVDVYEIYRHEVGKLGNLSQDELTDLAKQASEGDSASVTDLVLSHLHIFPKIAWGFAESLPHMQMDYVQEANLKIWRKASRYSQRERKTFGLFASTVGTNAMKDLYQREMRRRRRYTSCKHEWLDKLLAKSNTEGNNEDDWVDAGYEMDSSWLMEQVKEQIDTLAPMQGAVIKLYYEKGYNEAEIAEELGISRGSVKVHKYRGLKNLKKKLAEFAGVAKDVLEYMD